MSIISIFSEKIDIWSAGIVLYMMLSGIQPFDDDNVPKVISKITLAELDFNDKIWMEISLNAQFLIRQMLSKEANMRPSASEVLGHSWFLTNLS